MNDNIIPYVPIADRVQAATVESALLCQKFFLLIDEVIEAQLNFNHDTSKGSLCINPAHINDLMAELGDSVEVDVEILLPHLPNLIYPKFIGVKQIRSPIWNDEVVMVWHFQLDQVEKPVSESTAIIPRVLERESRFEQANDCLSEALGMLRVWRASLETHNNNPQLAYRANDVATLLLEIEHKLDKTKDMISVRK